MRSKQGSRERMEGWVGYLVVLVLFMAAGIGIGWGFKCNCHCCGKRCDDGPAKSRQEPLP